MGYHATFIFFLPLSWLMLLLRHYWNINMHADSPQKVWVYCQTWTEDGLEHRLKNSPESEARPWGEHEATQSGSAVSSETLLTNSFSLRHSWTRGFSTFRESEWNYRDSSAKNDNSVITYSPSFRSKPVWLSTCCENAKKMIWETLFLLPVQWKSLDKNSSSKYLLVCSTEDRQSYWFRTTWGWVNNSRIIYFFKASIPPCTDSAQAVWGAVHKQTLTWEAFSDPLRSRLWIMTPWARTWNLFT